MCNCGSKRTSFEQQTNMQSGSAYYKRTRPGETDVQFVYTGKTGLSATGPITGKQYRFNFTGDIQLVDYRDAPSMTAIPALKKLNNELQKKKY
jgi:hypothetical protein